MTLMTMISDVVTIWSEVYGNLILLSCCLSIIMLHCSQAMSCVTFITSVLNHFTSLQIVFNSITLSCIIVLLILNIIRFIKRCKSYCLINVQMCIDLKALLKIFYTFCSTISNILASKVSQ